MMKWRTRVFLLAVIWILLLVASVLFLSFLLERFSSSPHPIGAVSLNWSGYSISSDLANSEPHVFSVNASWKVPKVTVSATDAYSSAWIGIGGQQDKTLIQVGTEHDSINGQEYYAVWYELLPENVVTISNMTISPGDTIMASINLIDLEQQEWSIQIIDVTNGQEFNQDCCIIYNSSLLTGEWVVERPTVNNQLSNLADFGSVTFTDAHAMVNNSIGVMGSFPISKFTMHNDQYVALTTVSPISANGSSFSVKYLTSR
ncbi:hypothetical protein G4O51_10885 [Candidatus Bathyarchaeota archaeon A05DMB-2]|nr:hypothetical protein [Candidatus Bathyarchaeota archaeon A05DMB-2]